jgi:hypothetical protein
MRVRIDADDGDFIDIEIVGREHPGAEDYWDGNWLSSRISVKGRGFRGSFDASLRVEDFIEMRDTVRACMADLRGTFVFETMEGQLSITAKGDGLGHFEAACTGRSDPAPIGCHRLGCTARGIPRCWKARGLS